MLELGIYVDKLEKNENLIEYNILDALASDIKNSLDEITDWRNSQRILIKESKLKVSNMKSKIEDLRSQD